MLLRTTNRKIPDARAPVKLAVRSARSLGLRDAPKDPVDAKAGLRFEAGVRRREFKNWLSVANAVEAIRTLPAPGCSLHGIMRGNFSYADLVPAVLRLAAPATLTHVSATTLGFSVRASSMFLRLIDSGQIGTVDFVVADFFARADADVCRQFRADLESRGSRFVSARCHAKLLLFETTNGEHYTSESSANIRACRSIEQFCLTNDPELFQFHQSWITELFANVAKETT